MMTLLQDQSGHAGGDGMKKLLVPVLLAIAYFGATAKNEDAVGRWISQAMEHAGALLHAAGQKTSGVTVGTPQEQVIETGFAPDDGGEALVVKVINAARQSIQVAACGFTSATVAKALAAARKRGVDVHIVVDARNNQSKSSLAALSLLSSAGIPIRTSERYAVHHDNYLIIDRRTIQTGSLEYSSAAPRANSENVIVVWNNADLASAYLKHWQERFNGGVALRIAY
jgi:phosphatidylserine/phosphatidylglycerophosphate/cardiolipin synthase-like enzyme